MVDFEGGTVETVMERYRKEQTQGRSKQLPTSILIQGMPGSGKTELLNAIAGKRVIDTAQTLPTLELTWGPTPRWATPTATG